MELIKFVFWEAAKVLALVFLGLVAAKAVAALAVRRNWLKPALYAVILVLIGLGAWYAGNDVAAEMYMWSSVNYLNRGELVKAYENASQSVSLRPNKLLYWRVLVDTKIRMQQLQSALDDEPAVKSLSGDALDEEDEYQYALCGYFLGQYDNVVATTLRLIRQNPAYAAPYVLEGLAYTSERKYPEAQESFISVLRRFPGNQVAVENLARAYYLAGDRQQALDVLDQTAWALGVLDQTAQYPFPAAARQRFQALKGLYEQ